jgi:hypothetical protein
MHLVAIFKIKHQKLALRTESVGQQQSESVKITLCVLFLNCYTLDTFFNGVIAEMLRGILAFAFQQDKQCTYVYNVTFRRVGLTVVAEEKQLCSERIVELRAACQQYKDMEYCTTVRLWRIYLLSNNKTYKVRPKSFKTSVIKHR